MAEPLVYKGRPLVRCNNELYYGKPEDAYVVFIQILNTREKDGVQVADKVHVQLLSNDASLGPTARIIKQSERTGLFGALEIGDVWLKGAESGKI